MEDHEYLAIAWVQAWPFVSRLSFQQRLTSLNGSETELCHELERWLRTRLRGGSLASLDSLRRRAWFGCLEDAAPVARWELSDYLVYLAGQYVRQVGNECELADDIVTDGCDVAMLARRFRWLTLCLPGDLLVSAACAKAGRTPTSDWINVLSPHVRRTLDEGFAETHVHLGAALGFPLVWGTWLAHPKPLASPHGARDSEAPFGDMQLYDERMWAAAMARLLLAGFLAERRRSGARQPSFASYYPSIADPWFSAVHGFTRREVHALTQAVGTVLSGGRMPRAYSTHIAHTLYRRLSRLPKKLERALVTQSERATTVDGELLRTDPLSILYPPACGVASPETCFAHDALCYLRSAGRTDTAFATLFWQYERVRIETFRYLTLEPGTSGLDWFQKHARRLRLFRDGLRGQQAIAAAGLQGEVGSLRSLELRREPPTTRQEAMLDVAAIARAQRDYQPRNEKLEWGIVMHWLKRPPHAGPIELPRYASWARDARARADVLCWVLRALPECLAYIRGIDVASSELALPTWVTVMALEQVRAASAEAAHRLARAFPHERIGPFSLTYHAGEEYRRLVEGVRRVHELIDYGLLRAGDRIGHGLALADTREFTRPAGRLSHQPAEERLDDLLWELDRYDAGDLPVAGGRARFVETHACQLIRRIYGFRVHPNAQRDAGQLRDHQTARRHRVIIARRLQYPRACLVEANRLPIESPEDIVRAYLNDNTVIARGAEIVEVCSTEAELGMLKGAQSWLRRKLARMQITVECNPSSNHLIGDYESIDQHPALQLQPLSLQASADTVMVSINSDDPLTFATRLADEFGHMFYALLRAGTSAQDALCWLDRVRLQGLRSRFTTPASHSPAIYRALAARMPHMLPDQDEGRRSF